MYMCILTKKEYDTMKFIIKFRMSIILSLVKPEFDVAANKKSHVPNTTNTRKGYSLKYTKRSVDGGL